MELVPQAKEAHSANHSETSASIARPVGTSLPPLGQVMNASRKQWLLGGSCESDTMIRLPPIAYSDVQTYCSFSQSSPPVAKQSLMEDISEAVPPHLDQDLAISQCLITPVTDAVQPIDHSLQHDVSSVSEASGSQGRSDSGDLPTTHSASREVQVFPRYTQDWDTFRYVSSGRLRHDMFWNNDRVEQFLFSHPLHQTPYGWDPKRGGLTLRIYSLELQQQVPRSSKIPPSCAFKQCVRPCGHGHPTDCDYRVAFFEQTYSGSTRKRCCHRYAEDVHLGCLEHHLDFPKICAQLSVFSNPNLRRFSLGESKRSCQRPDDWRVIHDFIKACETNHGSFSRAQEATLGFHLTMLAMERERQNTNVRESTVRSA